MLRINKSVKKLLFLAIVYIFTWFISYVFINQDINLVLALDYFVQAWSFNGLERPMFVWFIYNALFILIVIAYLVIARRRN